MKRLSIFGCVLAAGLMITACDDSSNDDTKEHICEHFEAKADALGTDMLLKDMHKAYEVTVKMGKTSQSIEEANAEGNKEGSADSGDKGNGDGTSSGSGESGEQKDPKSNEDSGNGDNGAGAGNGDNGAGAGNPNPGTNPPEGGDTPNAGAVPDSPTKNTGKNEGDNTAAASGSQSPDAPAAPMVKVNVAKAGDIVLAVKDGSIEKVMMEGKAVTSTSPAKEAEGCKEVKKSQYKIDKAGDLTVILKADAGKKSVIIAYETVEPKAKGKDAETPDKK